VQAHARRERLVHAWALTGQARPGIPTSVFSSCAVDIILRWARQLVHLGAAATRVGWARGAGTFGSVLAARNRAEWVVADSSRKPRLGLDTAAIVCRVGRSWAGRSL